MGPLPKASYRNLMTSQKGHSPMKASANALLLTFAAILFHSASIAQQPVKFDSATISGLPVRNIGSAMMSGRVAAIDAITQDGRLTVFVGSASGGVWKSVNGGLTFKPVFDKQAVQSIGAVAIDRSNPKIVWAGSGESWARNSVSVGDGVYKSTDGGENWSNVGLKDSEHIAKILVDPKDGNTVYACAVGHLWNDNDERGVYKTTDGGTTWKKVLAGANASTGCGMISMSPQDPKTIFASTWDVRREGWTFRSGGPGSGLYKSTDAGEHWTDLTPANTKGLPEKPWGRTALAVAPSNPKVVYAMIESKDSALVRSEDGGGTWTKLDKSRFMVWRPFYFANLIVDPKDENKLFKVDLGLIYSTNGGRSFSRASGGAHGDFHDVWIDPSNSNIAYATDDGGLWRSEDGGTLWKHQVNLPVSQFYHVSIDQSNPYHVYGGLQDNSSWVGDSSYPGGVSNSRWENMYGGDGFWMWEDPSDANYIYAEAQGGEIGRVHRFTHQNRAIKPYPQYGEKKLRMNWNTPIQVSPTDKNTLYIGAQVLFRSRDHGQSWERISPDLTTNDPEKQKQEESGGVTVDNSAAEMHTTIYSISESPRDGQTIWVGTDDGNLQVTRDGAKSWTNVVGNVPSLPRASWVSWVEASLYDAGTAYATFDRHSFGDMEPHVFKTMDYGKTWTAIVGADSGVRGYAHVIKEDTVAPNLLFMGTEFGLWISLDGGKHWAQYKGHQFPMVAVRDIVVHPRESDLVVATHGRGIWIVDDITTLRKLTPEVMAQEAVFLQAKPAQQRLPATGGWVEGSAVFTGPNPPDAALITYYQSKRHIFGKMKLELFDSQGQLVDNLPPNIRRGLSRLELSIRLKAPHVPPAATAAFEAAQGPRVLPGTYTVKMTRGKETYSTQLAVGLDPRAKLTLYDRKLEFEAAMRLHRLLGEMSFDVDRINGVGNALIERGAKLKGDAAFSKRLQELAGKVEAMRKKIVATTEGGAITGEERIREKTTQLYGAILSYEGRPTDYQAARIDSLKKELEDVAGEFDAFVAKELSAVNKSLSQKKLEPIQPIDRKAWDAADTDSGAGAPGAAQFFRERD